MARIQDNVIRQRNHNAVSRLVRANGDKNALAGLKDNLDRALRIFNVCLAGSIWLSLTASFQTELGLNTNVTVNDLHRNALTGQGSGRAQQPSVITISHLPAKEY